MRALLPYIPILLAVGLTIFTVIDIALIDRSRVKGLPKLIWILICIVLVVIGPVLWFLLGRERLIDPSQAGGSFGPRPRRGPVAPRSWRSVFRGFPVLATTCPPQQDLTPLRVPWRSWRDWPEPLWTKTRICSAFAPGRWY